MFRNQLAKWMGSYPTPAAGLALGLSGMMVDWSLMVEGGHRIEAVGGVIAILLLLPLIGKYLLQPKRLHDDLSHVVIGSVVPTFAMALMVISGILTHWFSGAAELLWTVAVGLHFIFFSVFFYHRAKSFQLHHMVPSWFVPPIGIVVAAVYVPHVPWCITVAQILVLLGLIAYVILLPVMLYRLVLHDTIEMGARPTIAIMAAPASLTLAGYLTAVPHPYHFLVLVLLGVAFLMTLMIYLMLLHLLRLPFSPGFAAYTFPLVISATATYKVGLWAERVYPALLPWHEILTASMFQLVISTAVIAYVFIRYMMFLRKNWLTAVAVRTADSVQ